MSNKSSLILYFAASLVYMLAVVLNNNELMLVSKPVIAPAIFFFYFQEKKGDFNWMYALIITLFFTGDMIVLIEIPDAFVAVVSIFLGAYVLYLKGVIDDLVAFRLKFLTKTNLFTFLICSFFLIYLLISSLDILIASKTENLGLLVLYGIVLVLVGIVSSLNYILRPSRYTTFMILTTLCFVISDVFYVLKNDFVDIPVFNYLNNLTQLLSYYFLTRYFILKK